MTVGEDADRARDAMRAVGLGRLATAGLMGYCACGCGQRTPLATTSSYREGWVYGQPKRWMPSHRTRLPIVGMIDVLADGCWLWKGAAIKGYGVIKREGRFMWKVHRWLWELLHGELPDGLVLDHLCGVTLCVNPTHLEPVTPADNTRRGRSARLTPAAVAYIRSVGGRDQYALAERFGVTQSTISRVKLGKAWRDDEQVAS